jgi:hypothetical protein
MPNDEYGKEAIVEILIRRDNMSKDDAQKLVAEFEAELKELSERDDCIAAYAEVEDLFTDYFGLEPDYLFSFLQDLID